jgi:hypothetical protein
MTPLSLILSLWHLFLFFWTGIVVNLVRHVRDAVFPPWRQLKGEVVLVTNGTNQIGREVVTRLLQEGCHVVIWDIQQVWTVGTCCAVVRRVYRAQRRKR